MSPRGKSRPLGALVPFDGDAAVRLEGIDLAFTVPVVALSHDALLVRAPESSPAGSLVHIELTTGADLVQGMGEVAGVRPMGDGHELLIQLLYVDEQSRTVLRRLVAESDGETSVEWVGGAAPEPDSTESDSTDSGTGGSSAEDAESAATELRDSGTRDRDANEAEGPESVPPGVAAISLQGARDVEPVAELGSHESFVPERTEPVPEGGGPGSAPAASGDAAAGEPAPGDAEATRAEAVGGGAEPVAPLAWKLDPIDPTEVATVDLGSSALHSEPEVPEQASRRTVPSDFLAEAGLPPSATPEGDTRVPAAESESVEGSAPRHLGGAGHGMAGKGASASRSRSWIVPAGVLIVAFLAAAWWTRDAWLGRGTGPDSEPVSAPAASSDASPTGDGSTAIESSETAEDDGTGSSGPDAAPDIGAETDVPPPSLEPERVGAEPDEAASASTSPPMPLPTPPEGPRELRDVDVVGTRGETIVTLSLSAPIRESAVSTFALPTPPRFVVKLLGVRGTGLYAGGTPELARVRIGIHDGPGGEPETHVVFDLATLGTTGAVTVSGSNLVVRLTG